MNKFRILKCIDLKEGDYDGSSVVLSCSSEPEFMLFFPAEKDGAKLIDFVLDEKNDYDVNTNVLGIYLTLLNSWKATDKYLSGVIMDSTYNLDIKDEILNVKLALSNQDGNLDSLVNVNFIHAITLAAMEKIDIIITDNLIDKMIPDEESFLDKQNFETKPSRPAKPNFPEDKKIVDIAKKIMSGKIKK